MRSKASHETATNLQRWRAVVPRRGFDIWQCKSYLPNDCKNIHLDLLCGFSFHQTILHRVQTSASVSGRGALPSISVKSYCSATPAATNTVPVCRMTSGSPAKATTARPMNSGDSELERSSHAAASITFSVRANPGYSGTAVTPCGCSSTAMSVVSLSVAALDTP